MEAITAGDEVWDVPFLRDFLNDTACFFVLPFVDFLDGTASIFIIERTDKEPRLGDGYFIIRFPTLQIVYIV